MSDGQTPPPAVPAPLPPNLPHDSLKMNIIIASAICWIIAAFFVTLRIYTRGFIIRVLGASDWSILLALIFAGATCGGLIEQALNGAGHHIWDLDPNDSRAAMAWGRAAWYGILFYMLSLCFSKMAILLLYIHLFAFKWARQAGQILLGIVVVSHVYMAVVTFTACIPLYSYWDFTVTDKYCHPQSIWWSNTGLHMVTDFLIFLLPMPVVWTIRLPRRQKLILSGVFGFGFVVCFISILRLLQLLRAQTDPDFTYVAAELSYLTAVEINGAIVCACVMTLKPLAAKFFPRLWGSSHSSRSAASSSGRNYYYGRRRGSHNTLVNNNKQNYYHHGGRGPPTIGSLPSKYKGPLASMDRDHDVWIEGDVVGKRGLGGAGGGGGVVAGGRRRVWVDGGYVEIDDGEGDVWGVDVELAEHVGIPGGGRRGGPEGVVVSLPRPPPPVENGIVRVDTEVTVKVSKADI
ncbi:hypothetical protein C8A00DRAFT_32503 [Chaetomidium leptoderma]|uniref:Rhodopsin domain-containing protein n=1 Tax=Chaetomidium leptoderma TaxID=669021 RepID=A0AAN6VN67_9PEZI|nr:hypothetical protein C8A00DRAFT_32503 [Chaetomidium leptoderma]